ncbi:hypothetical protein KCU90_g5172, partial [Aureobasidium melanogenum]
MERAQLRTLFSAADIEPRKQFGNGRVQHADVAVLHFHRDTERTVRAKPRCLPRSPHADRIAAVGADLADQRAVECPHQRSTEAPLAAHPLRMRRHRPVDARERNGAWRNGRRSPRRSGGGRRYLILRGSKLSEQPGKTVKGKCRRGQIATVD